MKKEKKKKIRYLSPYTKLECKSGYQRNKGKNDEVEKGIGALLEQKLHSRK